MLEHICYLSEIIKIGKELKLSERETISTFIRNDLNVSRITVSFKVHINFAKKEYMVRKIINCYGMSKGIDNIYTLNTITINNDIDYPELYC